MGTEPHDAEYYRKKVAALETFLCWVQTGQRKFDGYDLFVDNTLNILRQIRPVAQVDYQGRAVPIGLLPDSAGVKHQQMSTVGRAYVDDPWGPYLQGNGQVAHTTGTTINVAILTIPAGYEARVHRIHSFASRTPDATHRIYNQHSFGTTPRTDAGYYINETTSQQVRWPSAKAQTTLATWAEDEKYIPMVAGDELMILLSNNSQAGDTLDYGFIYQQREVE